MRRQAVKNHRSSFESEPTWEIAHLFPYQGTWSEEEYLALDTNHLIEFSDGHLEVLPMPTTSHQLLLVFLYGLLAKFVEQRSLGRVALAALPVRLWRCKFREPDILFMSKEHDDRIGEEYWNGADLVMEVVSGKRNDDNRKRDLVIKRSEYARAGIPEYWIVDPEAEHITVLRLTGKRYVVHGDFAKGTVASSHLLDGFTANVTETFSQKLQRAQKKSVQTKRRPH